MSINIRVLNFTNGDVKIEKQGRSEDGRFREEEERLLEANQNWGTLLWHKGPQILVIGPATVCVAQLDGADDQALKCEVQGRDDEGRFTGEIQSRVLRRGEHWVFSVTKGQQLQLHEKKI